jgi:hypothetical protein
MDMVIYVRAPWTFNPSPYISRFPFYFSSDRIVVTFPKCTTFYDILQYDDMMDFFLLIHGS